MTQSTELLSAGDDEQVRLDPNQHEIGTTWMERVRISNRGP